MRTDKDIDSALHQMTDEEIQTACKVLNRLTAIVTQSRVRRDLVHAVIIIQLVMHRHHERRLADAL
jgi:hypothetical protein